MMDFAMHTVEPEPPLAWDGKLRRFRSRGRFWAPRTAGWHVTDAVRTIRALGYLVRTYQGGRDILNESGDTVAQGLTGGALITWAKRVYQKARRVESYGKPLATPLNLEPFALCGRRVERAPSLDEIERSWR